MHHKTAHVVKVIAKAISFVVTATQNVKSESQLDVVTKVLF